MQTIYIDAFKIHDLADDTLQYYVSPPIKGLEFPSLRSNVHTNASEDGVHVNAIYFGERRVTLTGKVHDVGSSANHMALRKAFLAALAPIRSSSGVLTQRELRFTDLAGDSYRLLGQIIGQPVMEYDQVRHSNFLIDFLGDSNVIESDDVQTVTLNNYTGGGFVLPAILPVIFSAGAGGSAIATNDGNEAAKPMITLAGPLTNPIITNQTTGESIQLTLTIAAGTEVVIDMAERTVIQGGETSQLAYKSGDWWVIEPGDNTLRLTTSVSGEAGNAVIEFRHAWVGV